MKCHPCLEVLPIHCHCRGFKLKRKKGGGARIWCLKTIAVFNYKGQQCLGFHDPQDPAGAQRAATLTLISGIVLPRVRLKQVVSRGQLKCLGDNRCHVSALHRDWPRVSKPCSLCKRPTSYEALNQTKEPPKRDQYQFFSSFQRVQSSFGNILTAPLLPGVRAMCAPCCKKLNRAVRASAAAVCSPGPAACTWPLTAGRGLHPGAHLTPEPALNLQANLAPGWRCCHSLETKSFMS